MISRIEKLYRNKKRLLRKFIGKGTLPTSTEIAADVASLKVLGISDLKLLNITDKLELLNFESTN